jgi:hypothetical protein
VISRFAGLVIAGRVPQCHPEPLAADSRSILFAASVVELAMKRAASGKHDFDLPIGAKLERL